MNNLPLIAKDFARGLGISLLAIIVVGLVYKFFIPILFTCLGAIMLFSIYMVGKTFREGREEKKVVDNA